ncbi:hypothetical protein, partial [Deinococcus wulumuqiensis]|uniref:hypothetical protein n=1 Tax=Deinococcus wulumuqiensis TaxID=980427 RepID=UPI001CEF9978
MFITLPCRSFHASYGRDSGTLHWRWRDSGKGPEPLSSARQTEAGEGSVELLGEVLEALRGTPA